jgi:hypothetical protein
LSGATPANAAICLFVKVPNSGKLASKVVVSTGNKALGSDLKYEIRQGINAAWPANRD